MRIHKFRGKRIDNGEWVYGWYVERQDTHYNTYSVIICEDEVASEVDPETVGQFTGKFDTSKEKREICEGDRVKATWSDNSEKDRLDLWTYGIIRFGEGEVDASDYEEYSINIIGFHIEYIKGCDCIPLSLLHYQKIEVIGNIHDNPELLEANNGR